MPPLAMPADHQLVLITSLAPGADRSLQQAATQSWTDADIAFCSINTAEEQARLGPDFPGVTFLAPERTAEAAAGKPVPFIHDMFALAAAHYPTATAFGVINDDILIRQGTDLVNGLSAHLAKAMILGPRVDIPRLDDAKDYQDQENVSFSTGYDLIILPRDQLDRLRFAPLAVGMPFWDYWLPLMAVIEDWPVHHIADQVLLHVRHETVWDDTVFVFFHALATALLQGLQGHSASEGPRFALSLDVLTRLYSDTFERATADTATAAQREALSQMYDLVQEVIVHHIKSNTQPLHLSNTHA